MTTPSANPTASYYYEDTEKPLDLKYYFFLFKKNFTLLVTFLVIGVTLISIYVSRLPDQYQTYSQILFEQAHGSQQMSQQMVLPDIWMEDYFMTQKEIMLGPTVLRQVVNELKLVDYFLAPDMDSAVNQTRSLLKVNRIRDSRLFNITASSPDPQFSVSLANSVARAYIRKNFEELLYFSKAILSWVPEEGKDVITIKDPFGEVKQVSRQELIKMLPSIQTDPTIHSLEEKKSALEAELTTLLKQYREKHPLVVKVQANIRFLEESVETERNRIIENLKQEASGRTQVSNARIVEEARLPKGPSGPNRMKMVVTATAVELGLILILIFLWDRFDDTVHSPDDLRRKGIALPFLGPVPFIKVYEVPPEERFLITHYQRRSEIAESFRYLRVAINFSAPAEKLKTLVFTSSIPNEGKSFMAHNIAVSLAQDGNRTLIIDADLRKPVAQRVYRMENLSGLSNFLTSDIPFDAIIRETFIENLWVILSGPVSPNPSEILGSSRMNDLLQFASERFDRIIIDTPPVTGIGDSLILGSITTHVVFVIRCSKTPVDVIQQSKDILEKSGVRIIGAILNQVDVEKERYGGYYKYYYQSHSHYGQASSPAE